MNHYIVADDAKVGRMTMVAVIRILDPDAQIEQAQNGQDAYASLERLTAANLPVRLVITDLNMPVMDGWALLQKIRAEPLYNTIPVAIFSAESELTVVQDIMHGHDPVAFVAKGVNREEMAAHLRRFLDGEKVLVFEAGTAPQANATGTKSALRIFTEAVAGTMAKFLKAGFTVESAQLLDPSSETTGNASGLFCAEFKLEGKGLQGIGRISLPAGFMAAFGRQFGADFGLFGDDTQAARDLLQEIANFIFNRARGDWNRTHGFQLAAGTPILIQRVSNNYGKRPPKRIISIPIEFLLGWLYVELLLEEFPEAQFALASQEKIG
ncbi:MAG: response regulator [Bdellovibrionota bacterium]